MSYEHKEGYGSIRKNTLKDEGSQQPDYRGDIMLDGKVWEIAGWIKQGKAGSFLSLKGQEPREKQDAPRPKAKTAHDIEDDIPF